MKTGNSQQVLMCLMLSTFGQISTKNAYTISVKKKLQKSIFGRGLTKVKFSKIIFFIIKKPKLILVNQLKLTKVENHQKSFLIN